MYNYVSRERQHARVNVTLHSWTATYRGRPNTFYRHAEFL